MESETIEIILIIITAVAFNIGMLFIVIQLFKMNANIKDMAQEIKWLINRLKGIEEPKALPIKRKRGRPPKQK